ncbi:SPFH domain-containing protein [Sphingobium sp. CCH11-B1]|jgi:regulator of protease activity HflC (stomatin/prohibitin superfamily)|uniref:SPFH domain-containing protein n=1 Tax=Sphingobium sp. CCH11-B1 TaxID=1768781 RepID=UPI00082BC3B4|nr:SPFH domain-containing protein [Sphingobium sp. CCH11-B1]MEA3388571.1 SPFH domain-containing protein [Pseudomonadota bacterium]
MTLLQATREKEASTASGYIMLLLLAFCIIGALAGLSLIGSEGSGTLGAILLPLSISLFIFTVPGFYLIQPNQAAAILLFGDYRGTDRTAGLRWVLPWLSRQKVSVRVHNVTSEKLKINDKRGNPVEIASNVVWRVTDTAQALFDVDDYKAFVEIQIESAVRAIGSRYPYDDFDHEEKTLRGDGAHVADELQAELQERVAIAGVSIDECRLTHLAYAPEIAQAMLRRQQAEAVIAARTRLVEGAVSMVELALEQLSAKNVVELDDERRAAMVSNLMVVLCGERDAQPVVNTGTLYQ